MGAEGTAAFGTASLALLRFTGGATAVALLGSASLAIWCIAPLMIATRRLSRLDV